MTTEYTYIPTTYRPIGPTLTELQYDEDGGKPYSVHDVGTDSRTAPGLYT